MNNTCKYYIFTYFKTNLFSIQLFTVKFYFVGLVNFAGFKCNLLATAKQYPVILTLLSRRASITSSSSALAHFYGLIFKFQTQNSLKAAFQGYNWMDFNPESACLLDRMCLCGCVCVRMGVCIFWQALKSIYSSFTNEPMTHL